VCYCDDASPPLPPIRGGADDHGDLTLTSADGTTFAAYYAHPDAPSSKAMVVLPDVRGLHQFYKDLARRFAEAGMHSVAIDYFGRTTDHTDRGEDFEFRSHVEQMHLARTNEDVGAAVAWLRALPGVDVESIFTVGFCMGGSLSWAQSSVDHGLQGCVGFYGQPARAADRIPKMSAPLLILAAGRDFTPVADVEKFADDVRAAGVEAELHVYPDAPHSYFDRSFGDHEEACADSWRRILAFVDRYSAGS
jgi:carboxymethylenebutenolidase